MLTRLIARSNVVAESATEYNAGIEYEYRDAEYEHEHEYCTPLSESSPIRRSSRLAIVSPSGRLLLFRCADKHSKPFWSTPGGELVGSETYIEAAIRELHEETGFNAEIGPFLRERDAVYAIARSKSERWVEQYFLVSVGNETIPNRDNWTEEEHTTIVDHHWWSLDELSKNPPSLKPEWIPELLAGANIG